MKVVCKDNTLSGEEKLARGFETQGTMRYDLTVGKEYLVLGINFLQARWNNGVSFLLRDDFGRCAFVPLALTEVADPRASAFWRARTRNDGSLSLWPEEFFSDYFHDELSNGDQKAAEAFKRAYRQLDEEFPLRWLGPVAAS
jgi:hypothetical protein